MCVYIIHMYVYIIRMYVYVSVCMCTYLRFDFSDALNRIENNYSPDKHDYLRFND